MYFVMSIALTCVRTFMEYFRTFILLASFLGMSSRYRAEPKTASLITSCLQWFWQIMLASDVMGPVISSERGQFSLAFDDSIWACICATQLYCIAK